MQHQGGLMQHQCGERATEKKKKAKNRAKQTHQPHGPDYRISYGIRIIEHCPGSRATTGCLFEQKGLEMHTIPPRRCPVSRSNIPDGQVEPLDLCRLIRSLIQLVLLVDFSAPTVHSGLF